VPQSEQSPVLARALWRFTWRYRWAESEFAATDPFGWPPYCHPIRLIGDFRFGSADHPATSVHDGQYSHAAIV
jgi:hypothetical protein